MIVSKHYEQTQTKKLGNLGERDEILERYDLIKVGQEESENLNRPITTNKIRAVFKNKIATRRSPGLNDFTGEFYQSFKELKPILLNFSKKFKRREDFQDLFTRPA